MLGDGLSLSAIFVVVVVVALQTIAQAMVIAMVGKRIDTFALNIGGIGMHGTT